MRYIALLWVLCFLCAACAAGGTSMPATTGRGLQIFPVSQRRMAPPLAGTTLTGHRLRLEDQVGRGMVAVNVWASWCGPCRKEMPLLARASGPSLRVIGIDERDDARSAGAFATSQGASYPSLSDPHGRLLAQMPMLPQTGVPSTLLVDRHGRIAARVVGPLDDVILQQIISTFGGPA